MTQALTKWAAVQNPGLNLFDVPPTDYSLAESRYVPINPFTTGIHPIDFQIDPQDDFINLAKSYFEVELQLKLDNAGNIANDTLVTICNNFIHSLFKQINVRLNGTLISPQTDNYHHKAFIDTVIHNDRDDGETILKTGGWFNGLTCRDASGTALTANQLNPAHDDFKALSQDEQNWVKSIKPFNGGAKEVLRFKPYLEVFQLSKLLVPGVQIQIQMYLNSREIWSQKHGGGRHIRDITADDLKITLFLNQNKVLPSVYRGLLNQFQKSSSKKAVYPTTRSEIRTFNHPNDSVYFEANNIFHNQRPNRVIVALLDQTAFNGSETKYAFGYKTFNITSIKQLVQGEEYPYRVLELDHQSSSQDLRGYHQFLQATECLTKRKGNMVRAEGWGRNKGCTLFVFNNAPSESLSSSVLNPPQTGEVKIVIRFGANPGVNLTVLVYGEFENLLEIDGNRTVLYDYYRS